jgi:hypothetical protein
MPSYLTPGIVRSSARSISSGRTPPTDSAAASPHATWGAVIDSSELLNKKLQEWQDFYNYARLHG